METAAHNNTLLGIHSQAGKKEWRAVTEGPRCDRDGSVEHGRVNGSVRLRPNSGLHTESSRNGRMIPTGGTSDSSSDSDNLAGDCHHANVLSQDAPRQNGDKPKLHNEDPHIHEHEPLSNGNLSSPLSRHVGLKLNETLEQRLHDVIRQREQLQRLEAELRGKFIARSEILKVQNSFDEQSKQHASIVSNLQEQLHERDHRLHELEQKLEERERQLHANQKEASEAVNQVWAKDGLLREQTSELTTLRRERENLLTEQKASLAKVESERAQLLSQFQDLQERFQEKERQLQEIEEQHRTAQDTLAYKDEQIREAQAWVQRAQELDAFYANTHNTLHAELRDRNEQINQLWLGQQRQLAEVNQYHSQTIQRLRMEVAELREQNRMLKGGSATTAAQSKIDQASNGDTEPSKASESSIKLSKGIAASSNQADHTGMLPVPAAPILGDTGPIPVHQFQPQELMPSLPVAPSQITQSSLNHHGSPVILQTPQQLPLIHPQAMQHSKLIQQPQATQQFVSHPQQVQVYSHFPEIKSPLSLHATGLHAQQQQVMDPQARDQSGPLNHVGFSHMANSSATQHASVPDISMHSEHPPHHDSVQLSDKVGPSKDVPEEKKQEAFGQTVIHPDVEEQELQHKRDVKDASLHEQLSDPLKQAGPVQGYYKNSSIQHLELPKASEESDNCPRNELELKEQQLSGRRLPAVHAVVAWEGNMKPGPHVPLASNGVTSAQQDLATEGNGKVPGPSLLDEESLLACLVRAIPSEPSARIKISTTLPNRLGKMLAPLHWHDYKKQYGRLDDFISSHPKLFVIDGDFVHLREGAHAIISATTAVAKVAAAAAAPTSLSPSWPPTVAVTPVAQSQLQRPRKNGQESFFPQLQMIGGNNQLHEGLVGGQKHVSVLGSRPGGVLSNGSNGSPVEFVEVSNGAYGATRKNDAAIYGNRQGARF